MVTPLPSRLDTKDTLKVLLLSHPGSARELAVVNEINPGVRVKIVSTDGPAGVLGRDDRRALSWRWDFRKGASLDEMREIPPGKVVLRRIDHVRALGSSSGRGATLRRCRRNDSRTPTATS